MSCQEEEHVDLGLLTAVLLTWLHKNATEPEGAQ